MIKLITILLLMEAIGVMAKMGDLSLGQPFLHPEIFFMLSEANENQTERSIATLGKTLADEI